jgi:hypothetical protein
MRRRSLSVDIGKGVISAKEKFRLAKYISVAPDENCQRADAESKPLDDAKSSPERRKTSSDAKSNSSPYGFPKVSSYSGT